MNVCVTRLRSTAVWVVPLGSWCARVACFHATLAPLSIRFRYVFQIQCIESLTLIHQQRWNGRLYDDSTLTSAGLVFQLGHYSGDACPRPTALHNLMVFDLSGAHRLVVKYCDCDRPAPKRVQLLRSRWFPATIERPSTAFAFDILDFFHKLQDRNKCNPYDFYHSIIQRTDAAGLKPEIVRFPHLLSCSRSS